MADAPRPNSTGSSAAAPLVSICIYAPTLLAPLAGLLAGRVRRRPLLVVADFGHLGLFGVAPTYMPQMDRHLGELLATPV